MSSVPITHVRQLSIEFLGFISTSCAYRLNLPSLLQESPKSISTLTSLTGARQEKLERVLLFLESLGLFKQDKATKEWGNTELGLSFIGDKPHPSFLLNGAPFALKGWSKFYEGLSSDKGHIELGLGKPVFEYLMSTPEDFKYFSTAMKLLTQYPLPDILKVIDLQESKRILDVGGGIGTLLCAVLEKYPHLQGGVYELPHIIAQGQGYVEQKQLTARVELLSGNFFENVPSGFDTIMMKSIIHDWDDENNIQILKNCRAALKPGNKLLIVGLIIDRNNPAYPAIRAEDMNMLGIDGIERTAEEHRFLLESSGFRLLRIDSAGLSSIIYGEAV